MRGWHDRGGLRLLATLGLVAAVVTAVALALTRDDVAAGLGPGSAVSWGLPVLGAVSLLLAVHTVGSLLVLVLLAPGDAAARSARSSIPFAACAWAVVSLLSLPLVVSESAGMPLADLTVHDVTLWTSSSPVLSAVGAACLAALVSTLAGPRTGRPAGGVLLVLALAAALIVPLSGHETGDGVRIAGLAVHIVAALVWTGGLYGLIVHVRYEPRRLARAARLFSTLALGCVTALLLSGVIAAALAVRVGERGLPGPWASPYGALVLAKAALLVMLVGIGALHRARSIPRLERDRPGSFRRWATGEVLVLVAAMGLASALGSTTAPPLPVGAPAHGHEGRIDPLTWETLLGSWRPNAVALTIALLAVGWYLRAVRGRSDWPVARTLSWVSGWTLAGLLTIGGAAVYADLLLSMHLVQLLLVGIVVPALLVGGRPELLLPGLRTPVERLARTAHVTALGAVPLAITLLLVHRPQVLDPVMTSPWWRLVLLAGAALMGLVLWTGVRHTPADAAWLLVVALACGLLAWRMQSGGLLAPDLFLERRLRGTEPIGDQQRAGRLALGAAVLLSLAALVVAQGLGGRPRSSNPPSGQSPTTATPRTASIGTGP
ncbi:cytochrome c oxidase assembly protein [Alteromonas gracilis]